MHEKRDTKRRFDYIKETLDIAYRELSLFSYEMREKRPIKQPNLREKRPAKGRSMHEKRHMEEIK